MNLDIIPVLEHYGCDPPHGYGWFSIRCPFHDDTNPSASVNVEEGAFVCFSCYVKGDTLKLIMVKEGLDFVGAIRKYEEITGAEVSDVSESTTQFSRRKISTDRKRDYERGSGFFSTGIRRRPIGR